MKPAQSEESDVVKFKSYQPCSYIDEIRIVHTYNNKGTVWRLNSHIGVDAQMPICTVAG